MPLPWSKVFRAPHHLQDTIHLPDVPTATTPRQATILLTRSIANNLPAGLLVNSWRVWRHYSPQNIPYHSPVHSDKSQNPPRGHTDKTSQHLAFLELPVPLPLAPFTVFQPCTPSTVSRSAATSGLLHGSSVQSPLTRSRLLHQLQIFIPMSPFVGSPFLRSPFHCHILPPAKFLSSHLSPIHFMYIYTFLLLFIACFFPLECKFRTNSGFVLFFDLFCSLLNECQCLLQGLVHNSCSINICKMSGWIEGKQDHAWSGPWVAL